MAELKGHDIFPGKRKEMNHFPLNEGEEKRKRA